MSTRIGAIGALITVAAVIAVLLFGGGGGYVVHARFADAGQLVKGGVVQVAGRTIGTISDITLTDNNQADVELNISDEEFKPLHRGTVATIRAVGLSGVANRFVELAPGPTDNEEIEDDGVLDLVSTRPIVDLDEVLNALDPKTRGKLQGLIRDGATIWSGRTEETNRALAYANPFVAQSRLFLDELTHDKAALERLVTTSATMAAALVERRDDLQALLTDTGTALRAVADERGALAETLDRGAPVLRQARSTLRGVRATLTDVRPMLREARPAAKPLARVLRLLPSTSRRSIPVVRDLRLALPDLLATLRELPALDAAAQPALRSLVLAVRDLLPILPGLRPYAPDVFHGVIQGFGGAASAVYDANGHAIRISPIGGAGGYAGITSGLPADGERRGLTARCPGAATEPSHDGSSPWIPDEAASTCDPKHTHP